MYQRCLALNVNKTQYKNNSLDKRMNMKSMTYKVLTTTLFLLLSFSANALQLNPLSLVLKPSGGGSKQSVTVSNESNEPIAVQLSITTRQQAGNKEIRKPADNLFNIYPPQMVIPPRSTQKVRIEWLGAANLPRENAYRLIAEQVYVSLDNKNQTGVKMLMTLIGALYVQPNGTKSNLQITSVKRHGNKLGITVQNSGNRHRLMKYATLILRNGGQTLSLKGKQILGLDGNNVLGGATKRFFIPLPKGFRDGPWKAQLKIPK